MKKRILIISINIYLTLSIFAQPSNVLSNTSVGKYKFELIELPDGSAKNIATDTITNVKFDLGQFMSIRDIFGNGIENDSILMVLVMSDKKQLKPRHYEFVKFVKANNSIGFSTSIPLISSEGPMGMIRPNYWYSDYEYKIIDVVHIECMEYWWQTLTYLGPRQEEHYKSVYFINHQQKTITQISRIKIE